MYSYEFWKNITSLIIRHSERFYFNELLLFFRNEVWRYNVKEFSTHNARLKALVFRGFKYGFGAFLITTLLETAYDKMYPDTHGHGSGHHW